MESFIDFDSLRQIKSLASLSGRQLIQIRKHLIWRHYLPNSLIRPHWVKQELEGLVFRGSVEVAILINGRREVVERIQTRQAINRDIWSQYPSPIELRAIESSTLCILPDNYSPSSSNLEFPSIRFDFSNIKSSYSIFREDWIRRGTILVLSISLFLIGLWCWHAFGRMVFSEILYGLGSHYLETSTPLMAEPFLQASIALNPGTVQAQNDIGYIYYQQGYLQEADAAFHQAIIADPQFAVAQNNVGFSLLQEGRLDLARLAFRQGVILNPENDVIWLNLGVVEQSAGKQEEAVKAYRTALRLNPDNTIAKINLGALYYEKGQFSEAKEYLEEILVEQPALPDARVMLGAIALIQGDQERAWQEFQMAIPVLADDPQLHFFLGLWYEKAGQWQEAIEEYDKVMALHPNPDIAILARSHMINISETHLSSQSIIGNVTKGE